MATALGQFVCMGGPLSPSSIWMTFYLLSGPSLKSGARQQPLLAPLPMRAMLLVLKAYYNHMQPLGWMGRSINLFSPWVTCLSHMWLMWSPNGYIWQYARGTIQKGETRLRPHVSVLFESCT